ncbi:Transketolase, pyrimidine binding domain-containing protein [Aspergillus heterothallicus]
MINAVAGVLGVPDQLFTLHKGLGRILQKRQRPLVDGKDIDLATAETLAMCRLCLEGYSVRVPAQDVERGTFSRGRAVLHDQVTGSTLTAVQSLSPGQSQFTIANSSLSEYGGMGFDYGYSCINPQALCIIDQYITSGENKWLLRSGLALSLPHGLDGKGSDHPFARMERFLQLRNEHSGLFPSAEKLSRRHQDANIHVVYMTPPGNLFSCIVPLIVLFSKSVLRHPMAKSNIKEFTENSKFRPDVRNDLESYPHASGVVWCHDVSLNDGAFAFAWTTLEAIVDNTDQHKGRRIRFAGRPARSSVATGHVIEH